MNISHSTQVKKWSISYRLHIITAGDCKAEYSNVVTKILILGVYDYISFDPRNEMQYIVLTLIICPRFQLTHYLITMLYPYNLSFLIVYPKKTT